MAKCAPDTTAVESSAIFTSAGWTMRPRCQAGPRQEREVRARRPPLGSPAENCTNGIITYTRADLFETQSPRAAPSARQRVQYTGAPNAENVRAVASHRRDGEGIIDKGNIYTAAQS